jgi:quercetin dioxygenase-like cupin family protein
VTREAPPAAGALVAPRESSPLSLESVDVVPGGSLAVGSEDGDSVLVVQDGHGTLQLDGGAHDLAAGTAALVLAGESAVVASDGGLRALVATISRGAERHAPLGDRAVTVQEDAVESGRATGKRSFQILFGPANGCERATLFLGYVPPGRAPWHYHLYDEIVLVRRGHARVHRADGTTEEAPAGTAFRLAPREVHIVENAGDEELAVLGLFTPAGSPSAAYLPAEAAPAQS